MEFADTGGKDPRSRLGRLGLLKNRPVEPDPSFAAQPNAQYGQEPSQEPMREMTLSDFRAELAAVMDEARVYLEGSWNVTGYVYNVFNEEYEQVYSKDAFKRAGEPVALPVRPEAGWQGDHAYLMPCSAEGRRLACAVFERSEPLSAVEKNSLATIFNTISSIAGSAMVNIEHQAEAAMLEKLRKSKNII